MPAQTPEDFSDRWGRVFAHLFDAHPANVALLNPDGLILAVNAGWRAYGRAHGLSSGYECVGQNYLATCEAGAADDHPGSREAYVGLLEVLRAGRPKFTLVYPCHSADRREWYRMWVEPQTPTVPAVIVAHQLVRSEAVESPPRVEPNPVVALLPRTYDARRAARQTPRVTVDC